MTFAPAIILWVCIVALFFSGGGIIPVILSAVVIAVSVSLKPWSWKAKHCRLIPRTPLPLLILYLLIMLMPTQFGHWGCSSGTVRGQQNQLVSETLDAVAEAGIDTGGAPVFSLTRNRSGTIRFLLLVLCALGGFLIMSMASARQRTTWLQALILVSAAMAAAGITGRWIFPQGDSLLWIFPVPHGRPGPMGAFMNRNHFAGYCAMITPVAILLSLHHFHHKNITGTLVNSMVALLLSSAVFLSLSRGGMLAWAAGMAILPLIGSRFIHFRLRWAGAILTLSVLFASVITLQHSAVKERISSIQKGTSDPSFTSRSEAWRGALKIWRHYPLLGAGPNAFRTVYPQHRISTAREARDFAENEYLQWLSETGLIGLILIGWMAFGAGAHLRKEAGRRSSYADPCMAAAACALAVAAIHALVDFPLRLPVYALTLASLSGMLRLPPADHVEARAHQNRAAGVGWVGLLIGMMTFTLHLQHDQPGRITSADFSKTARALASAPTFPSAWRRLANLLWTIDTPEARLLSEHTLSIAAHYDPNNYPLWMRLGEIRQKLGDEAGALQAYREVRRLRSWVRLPVNLPEEVP